MILDTLAQCSKERTDRKKAAVSLEEMKKGRLPCPAIQAFLLKQRCAKKESPIFAR